MMANERRAKLHLSLSSSSPSQSQSQTSPPSYHHQSPESVLIKLLPATILALASFLPSHDAEVLAYLLSRSISITTAKNHHHSNKCRSRKGSVTAQKAPVFRCGCFDCYTSFWCRWDSSPNRELIHRIIEAFEEHLLQNEPPKSKKQSRGRKRGKVTPRDVIGRLESDFSVNGPEKETPEMLVSETDESEVVMPEIEAVFENDEDKSEPEVVATGGDQEMELEVTVRDQQGSYENCRRRSLAWKVLPDVVGLLNYRLWSLWSPGI